jgi:hypothetical protein
MLSGYRRRLSNQLPGKISRLRTQYKAGLRKQPAFQRSSTLLLEMSNLCRSQRASTGNSATHPSCCPVLDPYTSILIGLHSCGTFPKSLADCNLRDSTSLAGQGPLAIRRRTYGNPWPETTNRHNHWQLLPFRRNKDWKSGAVLDFGLGRFLIPNS